MLLRTSERGEIAMSPKILFTSTADEIVQDARDMSPAGFELIVAAPGTPEYTAALPDSEFLIGNVQGMNDVFYQTARKLRLVQLVSAGYDHVDLDAARRAGIPVSNNGGANSRAVAEHTILLMLAVYRKLVPQHEMTAGGRRRGHPPHPPPYS